MQTMMKKIGYRTIGNSDFDSRFHRSGEYSAVAAIRMSRHSDSFTVQDVERFQIIDQPRGVPDIFSMNGPVRKFCIEIGRVIRPLAWANSFTIAQIIWC